MAVPGQPRARAAPRRELAASELFAVDAYSASSRPRGGGRPGGRPGGARPHRFLPGRRRPAARPRHSTWGGTAARVHPGGARRRPDLALARAPRAPRCPTRGRGRRACSTGSVGT